MMLWVVLFGSILAVLVFDRVQRHIRKQGYEEGFSEGRLEGFREGASLAYREGVRDGMKAVKKTPKATKGLTQEQIKTLITLCHPDKHNNSQTATQITQWLLTQRKVR